MNAQPDYLQLVAIAERVSQLSQLGLEVIGMDIGGTSPVFTVREAAPSLTGYYVQEL